MSHLIGILLALVSIAVTTCRAMPDFHKQMSPQQLQSIFHVDTPDAVPHYEVVQLLHHNTQEPATQQYNSQNYRRRKRSVEPLQQQEQDLKQQQQLLLRNTQHVKKDLSKNPYYSELKEKSAKSIHTNSVYEAVKADKELKDIKEHKVSFNAFGKNLNLTLKQTQGLFKDGQVHRLPMWYVDNEMNATHGLNLQKIEDELNHTSDNIGQVFQDEENMAAILMRRHEVTGDLVMEGSIGHDMVIKPLPHDLLPNQKESHHVIFKREADMSEHLSDFAFMEPDDLATSEKLEKLQNRHKRSAHRTTLEDIELEEELLEAEDGVEENEFAPHKRAKRQAPYIIYPEILVIVDYDGYRLHGGDNLQVKRYFISFWNGVDLRYRLLKGPRIRISIAGIIISRGRDATPYLERNRVGRDAIDSAAALTDMGKYLFRERRLPVYDIAVAITKYDMCRRRKGGRCTKGTAGFAYVGGACVVNKRLEKVNSVAIIEDTGGFSGIIVAAHEVGHLLGAVHDGSPPPSYLGGPGAQRCRWEDGYIMSDLRHTERGFRWSPCTVQSFHHFLNGDTATCLHNAPHEDSALGRSLPGTLLSLDAQCRRDRGTYACFKDERVCAQLFCFDAQTGYCVAYRPAAEGSSCGNGLHCLDGRCTPLPSNVIPNYGHQYRGYKSNEAIGDEYENKSKENNTKEDEGDEDEEEDDDDNDNEEEEEEDSSEEEEGGEEEDENDNNDSNYSDKQTSNINSNDNNDNDDDEQYLTEPFNEFNTKEHTANNRNNHNNNNKIIELRNDNNVDETMLKAKDEKENSLNLIKYKTTNQTLNTNVYNNLNTYQYLAQLWQNLQTTTTTTTTRKPLMVYQTHQQHNHQTTPEQVHLISNKGQGYVVVKTSTKSSISSSSENTPNFNINNNSDKTTKKHHTLDTIITTTTPKTITTTTTTTTSITPTTTTTTLLKSLRKQFQYYLKLLQENHSNNYNNKNKNDNSNRNNNNRYLNKNNNKSNYNRQTILPSKPYSNSLQNAGSASVTGTNEQQQEQDNDEDDEEDDGDAANNEGNTNNNNNGGDDNDESNETIEKLKRKLSIPLTTKTLQLQQQQQQQPQQLLPTTALPLTTTFIATATPRYGSKSTSSSTGRSSLVTPTFFENYFKKIQNQNQNPNSNQKPTTTAAELSKLEENKTKLKINNKNPEVQQQQPQQYAANNEEADKTDTNTFEAQFLKRTPTNPSKNEENYHDTDNNDDDVDDAFSSIRSSLNTNNPFNNKSYQTTATRSNISNSNNNRQIHNNNESILLVTPPAIRSQSPLYVTNYIGDNTQQRLTTIRHQPQRQDIATTTTTLLQQQQYNSHQHVSATSTQSTSPQPPSPQRSRSPNQQYESLYLYSSTTRRPKIKTQKLIRRLRTQIK